MGIRFSGRMGGGSDPQMDTLRSTDTVELLLGVGEGQNYGLANGPKSFFLGGTALVNADNSSNFADFQLEEYPGLPNPPPIQMAMGGFSSPVQVQTNIKKNIPVVRTGQQQNYDYVDIRFLINGLYHQKDDGNYSYNLDILIEQKGSNETEWKPAFATTLPNLGNSQTSGTKNGGNFWRTTGTVQPVTTTTSDSPPTIYQADQPPAPADPSTIWLSANEDGKPYSWNGTSWVALNTTEEDQWWSFTNANGDTIRYYKATDSAPVDAPIGSIWPNQASQTPTVYNGTSWLSNILQNSPATVTGGILKDGVLSLYEKISSPTVREVRIQIPNRATTTDIRVTKLSDDTSADTKYVSEIQWESFQEVVAKSQAFPNTHILHLIGQATNQFNSLPELTGDVKGRIVKVPSNYDPVTRTYNGIWDYTYKLAWTDNGAFCTQDFIENDSYGLSSLYPQSVNKSSFYAWAQWCDAPVPDGKGGTRPRWTYNDVISEQRSAREYVQYMAGACGARLIDDGNGYWDVLVDMDSPMTAIFAKENVVDGDFKYSFTDIQTRANWIKVGFINPELNWETDYRVVADPDHIAEFGRIPLEFAAPGKTNVSEALAAARLRLATGTTEKTTVTFSTNRQGKLLWPFQVIGIVDPDMGWALSGRIHAKTGRKSVSLRDAVTLEQGVQYLATFNIAVDNGDGTGSIATWESNVVTAPGTVTQLDFEDQLPDNLPEYAQFSLSAPNQLGLPKPFRIISISPADGDGEAVEILALELNRNKYAYVDGTTDDLLPTPDYSNFGGQVAPPQNVKGVLQTVSRGGVVERVLDLTWDAPSNPLNALVTVEVSRDGNPFVKEGETNTQFWEVDDVSGDTIVVRLTAWSFDRLRHSTPVLFSHTVSGDGVYRSTGPISNLAVADAPAPGLFDSRSPKFTWDDDSPPDPNWTRYRVKILDADTRVVKRTEDVTDKTWTYDYDKQVADKASLAAGPARTFIISVCKADDFGNEGIDTELNVSNPVPAVPHATVDPAVGAIHVDLAAPTEKDIAGALVWVSNQDGFDHTAISPTYDAAQTQFHFPADPTQNYFIRVAFYDSFSKVIGELNVSGQFEATPLQVDAQTVGGILAQDLIDQVTELDQTVAAFQAQTDDEVETILTGALAAAQTKAQSEAATYIGNAPIGPIVEQHTNQLDGVTEDLKLLGQKSADGSSWVLDMTTVIDSDGVAMSDRLNALQSQISTNYETLSGTITTTVQAAITTEQQTRTSADQALTKQISDLSSTVSGNYTTLNSSIQSEAFTRSTQDDTLSGRIDTLSSTVSGNFGTLNASIQSEATTRASQDGALSQRIDTVSSTAGSAYSQVQTTSSAFSTLSGQVYATYTLTANANGNIASMRLLSSSGASDVNAVIFETDNFLIKSGGNGSKRPFLYTNGTLYLNEVVAGSGNIAALSVQTLHIQNANVTRATFGSDGNTRTMSNSGNPGVITSETVTVNGTGPVVVTVSVDTLTHSDDTCYIAVYRNGSLMGTYSSRTYDDDANWYTRWAIQLDTNPPAGNITYGVSFWTSGGSQGQARNVRWQIIEYMK